MSNFPLRLSPEINRKIRIIAEKEKRPITGQIEIAIEEFIIKYEKEHGVIEKTE